MPSEEDLADAEDRARRAVERAKDAEEAYRKAQLEIVAARDEAESAKKRVAELEAELAKRPKTVPPPSGGPSAQVEEVLARIESLKELLRVAAQELSDLHAEEVALGTKRTRVLSDACTLLARAIGESGQAPPPIPGSALAKRLSVQPSVDISEVALLVEWFGTPAPPKLE